MRRGALCLVAVLSAGCPGGGSGLGDSCGGNGDCDGDLQCVEHVCVPRCERAPECGDGFSCDNKGLCHAATGQAGTSCTSEVDCAAGLSCQLAGSAAGSDGFLLASCTAQNGDAHPANAECIADADCRNGTCALGRCVDLCADSRDCAPGTSCTEIPRIEAEGAPFRGCLPTIGTLAFDLPVAGPSTNVLLPIPARTRSVAVSMVVDDLHQEVGALAVTSPSNNVLFSTDLDPFMTQVRHAPQLGQSVLAMPSSPDGPLEADGTLEIGAYQLEISSLNPPFFNEDNLPITGSAIPRARAVLKLDSGNILDLHFYFLDLDEHPCAAAFENGTSSPTLNASVAQTASFFQTDYLDRLHEILTQGNVALGQTTYEDIIGHGDLDGLDVADAGTLLQLGSHDTGINVFFVRSLSPAGLQAFGPNPGPANLPNTRQSGIIISADTLCYEPDGWRSVARLTAHELARYMGLYNNVELASPTEQDPISDSDTSSENLMFYSDNTSGFELSAGQRNILSRSGVLR